MDSSRAIRLADVRLARDAGTNDAAARALLDKVALPTRRMVRKLVGNRTEIDDYVQEALLAILRSSRSFRGAGSLESWAVAIAFRVTMRGLKHESRRARTVRSDPRLERRVPSEEHTGSDHELAERFRLHLTKLPIEQAESLILRVVMGYTVDEVAQIAKVSRNTVRGRIRTALAKLRKSIGSDAIFLELSGRRDA